jgi:hypothetical protein
MSVITFDVNRDITIEDAKIVYGNKVAKTVDQIFIDELTEYSGNTFNKRKLFVPKLEAVSDLPELYTASCHPFVAALHNAYGFHIALELRPDDIKLLISQGLAIHIKLNSEEFRSLFVDHKDKKDITIVRNDFIKGVKNPWHEVFGEFSNKIKHDVKDPILVSHMQRRFETSTIDTIATSDIAIMDTFQKYYDYKLYTACGIPSITLKGSVDDWKAIKEYVQYIEKYNLQWWTSKLLPIIDQFINTVESHIDRDFWNSMVKVNDGSGGPYYSGWFKYLFPYIRDREDNYIQNPYNDEITSTCIPLSISKVPFKWNYYGVNFDMMFNGGFIGIDIDRSNVSTGAIRPVIAWSVQNLSENNIEIPQEIINCLKHGISYDPAWTHYHRDDIIVNCDWCGNIDIQSSIGLDNIDLCRNCVKQLTLINNRYTTLSNE